MADINLTTSTSPAPLAAPALGNTSTTAVYGGTGLVQWVPDQSTGTGVIDSFVQVQATGTEEGFNSDTKNLDIGSSHTFNHSIQVSDVGSVVIGGTAYLQFLLDVNQTGSTPLLSLDQVQIFTSATNNTTSTTLASLAASSTKVFQSDQSIYLDFSLNPGSGAGDMFLYVQRSLFGADSNFVYLYSHFGNTFATNDGFEEWAVIHGTAVPEPGFYGILSLGLGALFVFAKRRKRIA
jgi:hypothetical protein